MYLKNSEKTKLFKFLLIFKRKYFYAYERKLARKETNINLF